MFGVLKFVISNVVVIGNDVVKLYNLLIGHSYNYNVQTHCASDVIAIVIIKAPLVWYVT